MAKKYKYSIFFIIFFLNSFHCFLYAQNFEGYIKFTKELPDDTVFYTYWVKENMVRIDEQNREFGTNNSLIVDLDAETQIALNHARRKYMFVTDKNDVEKIKDYKIQKSPNTKTILGQTCNQWKVKSVDKDTDISYWVIKGNYFFFNRLLKILNRPERSSNFYVQIPDNSGYFPMLSEERTITRLLVMRLAVTEIKTEPLKSRLFEIPNDYKQYR